MVHSKGMVEFDGRLRFRPRQNGLVPSAVDTWENFVYVNLNGKAGSLQNFLGKVPELVAPLQLSRKT